MPEVRETGDHVLAHPQRLGEHSHRLPGFLQGLAEDHVVEAVVRIVRKAFVEVAVIDRDAFGDRVVDLVLRDLDARAAHRLGIDEHLEKDALAAPQVQYPGAGRHHLHDEEVVPADPFRVPRYSARHEAAPCAGRWSPRSATSRG